MHINTIMVELLFNLVFISQMILLSWYYPRIIINRLTKVMDKYPPHEYPKLYTKPKDYYQKKITTFADLCTLAQIACLVIVLISWNLGNSPNEEMLVLICFAVQVLPIIILSIMAAKYFKKMKKVFQSSNREANLQPRRIFDFISAKLLGIAIILYVVYLLVYLYFNNFNIFLDGKVPLTLIGVTLIQLYFCMVFYWKMYGRKQNPYSVNEDRVREIKTVGKIAVYASIIMSLYLTVATIMDNFSYLDSLDPMMLSIYLQMITIFGIGAEIRMIKIEDINFDVYKNNIIKDTSVA
ncbi:MAG: hypothetical protein JKY19_03595 [Alcanivoracaceae bacterium]|nr:hypothetical protein [Alcanivoracaceae bacterium]